MINEEENGDIPQSREESVSSETSGANNSPAAPDLFPVERGLPFWAEANLAPQPQKFAQNQADQQSSPNQAAPPPADDSTAPAPTGITWFDAAATPVIRLPANTSLENVEISGEDILIKNPDGSVVVIEKGVVHVPTLYIGDVQVPSSTLATIFAQAGILPAAGAEGPQAVEGSGGDFTVPIGGIGPGFPISPLLPPTALSFPSLERQEILYDVRLTQEGLLGPSQADVIITNLTPQAQGGDAAAAEASLPDGSAPGEQGAFAVGDFNISAPDGLQNLTIGGHPIVTDGVFTPASFETPLGNVLAITGFDPATGTVNYNYLLNDNEQHPPANGNNNLFENFAVVVTDVDGSTATNTLSVKIVDDIPDAHDDGDFVQLGEGEGGSIVATGNVVTGVDQPSGDANSTDGVADTPGADGLDLVTWPAAVEGVIEGLYGTLFIGSGGDYTYVLNVQNPALEELVNGQFFTDTFTYTITDGDGDTDTAELTITIRGQDHGVEITNLTPMATGSDVVVDEDDLPTGSDNTKESTIQPGTFNVSAPDGLDDLTVGGHAVIVDGVFSPSSFTTPLGNTLAFTAFNAATGEVSYTYTLTAAETHPAGNAALFEDLAVVATDVDGSSAADTLWVRIIDDRPTARNDADSVREDGPTIATGNVITAIDVPGGDVNTSDGVADTPGADGVLIGWTGAVGSTVAGLYGTLSFEANGNYTYTLDNGHAAVQGLSTGQFLVDTFNYTLTDNDGDTSSAVLAVTINGRDDVVTITDLTPEASGGDASVNEKFLPDGSTPDASALTQPGDFVITAPDGLLELMIGGHPVVAGGVFTPTSFETLLGNTLSILGYDSSTGVVTYSYTLNDNEPHPAANGANNVFESFLVVATDEDGSSATDTLAIKVIDDLPDALDDNDSVDKGGPTVATGNVVTGIDPAPDANVTDGVADLLGADGLGAVAWAGAVANSVTGVHGTLTVDAAGNYSYALNTADAAVQSLPMNAFLLDTFTYTVTDADGDADPAVLTITIVNTDEGVTITNLTPAAQGGDAVVDEDDLPNGSDQAKEPLTQVGDFNVSAPDGLDDLTVDGHNVIVNGVFSASSFVTALGNTLAFTAYDTGTGKVTYSYTLAQNETHSPGASENSLFENFAVVATDVDGSSANDILSVNIVDDVPSAGPASKSVVAGQGDTNVQLILDISGSMTEASGLTGLTRLDVLKASVKTVLQDYQSHGDVRVQLIGFSSGADQFGTDWMTVQEAEATIDALSAAGLTNYDAALDLAMSAFGQLGKLAGAQNVAYFISDGEPNQPVGSAGVNAAEEAAWTSFATANDINTFALGSGPEASQLPLDPIAYNGQLDMDSDAIIVTNLGDLPTSLSNTVSVPMIGNLVTDGGGQFGADGGFVKSVTVDGTTYDYNPAGGGSIGFSGGPNNSVFNTATNSLDVSLLSGGLFSVDMDNGVYSYTPPVGAPADFDETIGYSLSDADGDSAASIVTIHVTVTDLPPIVRDDLVITNQPNQTGLDQVVIPDFALLFNDIDVEGQPLSVTGVSNGAGGTVTHDGSSVTFSELMNAENDGGTFSYTGSDGTGSDSATVTIDRAQRGEETLDGTGLGDILLGRDVKDFLFGYEGNDVLIGLGGNDSLLGGSGDDLLVGGPGTDTLSGGDGNDVYVIDPSHLVSGHDVIADYQSGDVIDLSQIFGAVGGADAGNVDSLVNLQPAGANTSVMVDSDGAGAGTAFVQVAVMTGSVASISVLYDAAAAPAQNVT
jgi:VCBS repeat-containing protein